MPSLIVRRNNPGISGIAQTIGDALYGDPNAEIRAAEARARINRQGILNAQTQQQMELQREHAARLQALHEQELAKETLGVQNMQDRLDAAQRVGIGRLAVRGQLPDQMAYDYNISHTEPELGSAFGSLDTSGAGLDPKFELTPEQESVRAREFAAQAQADLNASNFYNLEDPSAAVQGAIDVEDYLDPDVDMLNSQELALAQRAASGRGRGTRGGLGLPEGDPSQIGPNLRQRTRITQETALEEILRRAEESGHLSGSTGLLGFLTQALPFTEGGEQAADILSVEGGDAISMLTEARQISGVNLFGNTTEREVALGAAAYALAKITPGMDAQTQAERARFRINVLQDVSGSLAGPRYEITNPTLKRQYDKLRSEIHATREEERARQGLPLLGRVPPTTPQVNTAQRERRARQQQAQPAQAPLPAQPAQPARPQGAPAGAVFDAQTNQWYAPDGSGGWEPWNG